jgi:hypothetical protein
MNKLVLAIALGATILSTQAVAQNAPDADADTGGGRQITRDEARAFADSMFQRLDINHDGVVTRDEAEQGLAQFSRDGSGKHAAKGEKMIDRVFGTSQSVTEQQFDALAVAKFDRQDVNRDGVVTPDERHPGRARGHD